MGQFEHGRRAAGVVVGAGMNFAIGIEAQAASTVADVVVMGTNNYHLIAQFRIAAGEHRQDIAEVGRKRLKEAAVLATALEMQQLIMLDEIIASRLAAPRAGLAAFQFRGRQMADIFTHVGGLDRLEPA